MRASLLRRVVDQQPHFQRVLKVVAGVNLPVGQRPATRSVAGQRVQHDMVDPQHRLEAELHERPVEVLFHPLWLWGTRVACQIVGQARHRLGQPGRGGEHLIELGGHGTRRMLVERSVEGRLAAFSVPLDGVKCHLARKLLDLCVGIPGVPIDLRQLLERTFAQLDLAVARAAPPQVLDILFRQRQLGKVGGARRVADANGLQKAAAAFEFLDVSQHFEQPLGRRVDAHGPGRHHLAVHRSWQ